MRSNQKFYTSIASVLFIGISWFSDAQSIDQLVKVKSRYAFIENKGQVTDQFRNPNPSVKFILNLPNNNVVLKATGFSYDSYIADIKDRPQSKELSHLSRENDKEREKDITYKYHRVDVKFEGGNPHAEVIAEDKSNEYINYYTSAGGQEIKVHHYSKVTYKDIYPRIDVEFIARPGESKPVEYNFIVHPGGDINKIKLRYSGANSSKLVNDKLELTLAYGKLTESIPASYWQRSKDQEHIRYKQISSKRNEITLGFASEEGKSTKHPGEALIIDPTPNLDWGTYYGGEGDDLGNDIAIDDAGNVFVVGSTNSTASIATSGVFQTSIAGGYDIFVLKLTSAGLPIWATYYGGGGDDIGRAIKLDASGNIFISGYTSTTSGIAVGGHQTTHGGGVWDALIVKFNSGGSRLWSTYCGGSNSDYGYDVAVDPSGNIFVVGYTLSDNLIFDSGHQVNYGGGGTDGYIVKFNTNGVRLWGTYYGGSQFDLALSVVSDPSGNICVAGWTTSNGMATSGALQGTLQGANDAFIAKFNSNGIRQWSTYYGGAGSLVSNIARKIAIDGSGNFFVVGRTNASSGIAAGGGHQSIHGGNDDAFLIKLNSSGGRYWATYYGGSEYEIGEDVVTDASGNVYILGSTSSVSSIATAGSHQSVYNGSDAFVAKFNTNGVRQWGTYYGGTGIETPYGLVSDASENIYITGQTTSSSSISTSGAFKPNKDAQADAFIAKFNSCLGANVTATELNCDICIGATSPRCQGSGTTQFTSTIANSSSITWTISDDNPSISNSINSSTGLVTWDPSFTGQATMTLVASGCGTPVTHSKIITVSPPISASALTCNICEQATRCQGSGTTQINSTITGTPTWEISDNNPEVSNTISPTGVVSWNPSFAGQATITLTVTGCSGTLPPLTKTITVTPSASASPLNCDICNVATRCQGSGTTQINSTITGTPTWEISDNNPEVSNTVSPTGVVSWNPSFSGQATITLTVTGCGGTLPPLTKTITVTQSMSATPLACDICGVANPLRCQGTGTTQINSTIVGTGAWTISDDNPGVSNTINPTTGLITWDPAFTGQATITLTVTGCGTPIPPLTKIVTVTPGVSATPLTCDICGVPVPSRCQGTGATQLNSTISGTAAWTISDDNPEVSNTISSTGQVTWHPAFTGQATITLTVSGCGGPITRSQIITVTPNVTATPLNCDICEAASRCEGTGTTQFNSTINNPATIIWTVTDDNPLISNTISPSGMVTWNSSFTGPAAITVTATGCGGPVSQSKTILVKERYATPSVTLAGPSFVCPGSPAVFTATVSNGGASTQVDFLVNDQLQTSGTSTTFTVNEWNFENGSVVRCRVPSVTECFAGQGPYSLLLPVYTQLDGVVDILPQGGDARCQGPGTTQFTPSVFLTDYVWSIENVIGTTSISANGLVSWDPIETGYPEVSITAQECPSAKTKLPYYVQPPPDAPANQEMTGCNWENIILRAQSAGNSIDWYYNNELVHTGNVFEAGNYPVVGIYQFFTEAVTPLGCKSENKGSVDLHITAGCDDDRLNWIETKAFDENSEIYSHSKKYFDFTGKSLQAQTKLFSHPAGTKVLANQSLRDKFGREVSTTLTAPLQVTDFNYRYGFVLNASAAPYNADNFDGNKIFSPDPVNNIEPGTLGWYYSPNNTVENYVPVTGFPYSRTSFYDDGSEELKYSASPGDQHKLGAGHEVLSGTFPVFDELNDYLTRRSTALPEVSSNSSLAKNASQSIVRDENGKYSVIIKDKSGNIIMSARSGSPAENSLIVSNNNVTYYGSSGLNYDGKMTYFYLLSDQVVPISGSSDFVVENIVTGERKPSGETFAGAGSKWPAGFYRILLSNGSDEITVSFVNYFEDVSYQFYDDANRLKVSVSPNGYKSWKSGVAYNLIDKTTYQYNNQGWLLSMTEPDAGRSRYVYRRDGQIRFSQNAEQKSNNRFSYTHYDKLGRPIESGEYIGGALTFIPMDSAAFSSSIMKSDLEKTFDQVSWTLADKRDWSKTNYDVPASSIPHIPSTLSQTYLRGAVSWSENVNNKTWYSYDEQGKVTWVAQKPAYLNRTFVSRYVYDLLGNTILVENASYSNGSLLRTFYHHYEYDKDKRLSKVYTSTDGVNKKLNASYVYYLHGPLKRIELGDKVQGIDFVYNIQGWLTQINHPDKSRDPGGDTNDVFGMVLDYYESAINGLLQTSSIEDISNPIRFHRLPALGESRSLLSSRPSVNSFKDDLRSSLQQIRALMPESGKSKKEFTRKVG